VTERHVSRVVPCVRTLERERPVLRQAPVPRRGAELARARAGSTIGCVNAPAGVPPRIQIPRWIQLVGLPLLIVFGWVLATTAGHAVLLFIIAALIALLLDPIVRTMGRLRIRRGFSVAIVYSTFAAIVVVIVLAIGTVVVGQTKTAADRLNDYFNATDGRTQQTAADRDVDRLQTWLNEHRLESITIAERGHRLVRRIRERDVGKYTDQVVTFVEGAAISIGKGVFNTVLILVISIYMLLDMPRLQRVVDRRFPPHPGQGPLLMRIESALASYVRGQALLSFIIGTSAAIGIYILGVTGLLPHADNYALIFGAWVALTEVLPYLGPWLGAIPVGIYAVVVDPIALIWVTILFLAIHQIEGHIVVPNVMGSALRMHPLLVIFGLLVGFEVDGLIGALIALPLLAAVGAMWAFFSERLVLEPWTGSPGIPVEVEPVEPEPVRSITGDR
jgi:predicted PurR-regulated permease PerM